jgi:hypothetical protein
MQTVFGSIVVALILAGAPAAGLADATLDVTGTSSAHVVITTGADGEKTTAVTFRNVRFDTYQVFVGEKGEQPSRLATITSEYTLRTDREPADPDAHLTVTVDDISTGALKRIASFTDPGQSGAIVASMYFASTLVGCCDAPDIHAVRLLETGTALFTSTGPGDIGSTGWVEAPNSKPQIARWAAFNGVTKEGDDKRGILGTISYGGPAGVLSTVQVSTPKSDQYDDLWEGLAHGASFLWLDPKAKGDNAKPGAGDPGSAYSIWALDKLTDPQKFGGFQLVLVLGDKRLAFIPVEHDRLVLKGAVLSPRISVTAMP